MRVCVFAWMLIFHHIFYFFFILIESPYTRTRFNFALLRWVDVNMYICIYASNSPMLNVLWQYIEWNRNKKFELKINIKKMMRKSSWVEYMHTYNVQQVNWGSSSLFLLFLQANGKGIYISEGNRLLISQTYIYIISDIELNDWEKITSPLDVWETSK